MKVLVVRLTLALVIALLALPAPAPALAGQPPANAVLLNADPANATLRLTTTVVQQDRFNPAAPTYTAGITDVKFTVRRLRTDQRVSDTIPVPLLMQRNGVKWFEQNMLISGTGFYRSGLYAYGKQQGQGRDLNVRVLYPRNAEWNGRLFFWHHGSADNQLWAYTPVIEPELLLKEGLAVAMAQFSGPAPAQQNPNATDLSYWASVDEMFLADMNNYWSYAAHPDWWSNNGSALGDGATLRNITNLVKNLLRYETGRFPERAYWFGWSAGGPAGTALNTGRDAWGNYTGGAYNLPYQPGSGLLYDAFLALAPVNALAAPVDPVYPIAAPHVFVDGSVDLLSLSMPNALNVSRKVKAALDATNPDGSPQADPALSRDVNDWIRLYTQRYGNHDWNARFFETLYSGADRPVYFDLSRPGSAGFNTEGRGREVNWVSAVLSEKSPVYLGLLADQSVAGWGQLASDYHQRNDGYHFQLFRNTVAWAEQRVPPPLSRIDPYLLDPAVNLDTATYPPLPVNDFAQDSLNRAPSALKPYKADIQWLRDNPDKGLRFAEGKGLVEMPNVTARMGLFYVGYKYLQLLPFTAEQLREGYHYGNVDFAGYADAAAYDAAFNAALNTLAAEALYDPAVPAR